MGGLLRGVVASLCILAADQTAGAEGRAFWLTRWEARDAGAIVSALEGMAALRANTLFLQVYGDGMALHRSSLAPRSPLVAQDFDPLALAVTEGHRRGIEVHAWLNVCNVWSGGLGTPASSTHVLRRHPEWAAVDVFGKSDLEFAGVPDTLLFFCPEWEGFRDYNVQLAAEVAARYDVDGVHLDYLRFPVGDPRCFCAAHRASFEARFGRSPSDGDPDFIEARFDTITGLYGEIYQAVGAVRPAAKVSAAVVAPSGRYYQDAKRILEAGWLDIAVPMIYTPEPDLFRERARWFHENSGGRLVYPGLSADGAVVGAEVAIARSLGLEGATLFSWSTLEAAGRSDLAALWTAPTAPPALPWKDGSPDRTAPVISGARAAGVLADEATILWHSDEKTRGRVEYGLTTSLGSAVEPPGFQFDHAVRLAGLRASTTYHYRAVSTDPAANVTRAPIHSFNTSAATAVEIAVDDGDDGFTRSGSWSPGSSAGGFGGDYLFSSDQGQETAWAEYRPYLPRAGIWEVAAWYVAGANRVSDARYTVVHSTGSRAVLVDQRSGGGRWNSLGRYRFAAGTSGYARLSNQASGGDVVIADAVRFLLITPEVTFVRGDSNRDGEVDLSDAVAVLLFLFLGQAAASCPDAADGDDSGRLDVTDAVFLLRHLFLADRAPPAPFPAPGTDPTADGLAECRE